MWLDQPRIQRTRSTENIAIFRYRITVTLPIMGGSATLKCQSYTGNEFPPMTVTDGLAQFEAMGVHFAGYVTPQGHVKMSSGYGATISGQIKEVPVDEDFDGDFDSTTHVLHGRVTGACSYNVAWQRTA